MDLVRAQNYRVDTNTGVRDYDKLRLAFPSLGDLPSLYQLQSRIAYLSGVKPVYYDCCINSCCCFVGPYATLDKCPYCDENCRGSDGKRRNAYPYLPIIPRLVNMFLDKDMCEKLRYRSQYPFHPDGVYDVFDSEQYRHLLHTRPVIGDDVLPHTFFSHDNDIAMGISTDGFGPFKKRTQTCWPIIGFLYNLPPHIHFHLVNVICIGVIPGPKSPKDIHSFLFPLKEEFIDLVFGVPAFDILLAKSFPLHVYPILGFGDMPAIAKLMRMKGHNGKYPCRTCKICGVYHQDSRHYYAPLRRPNGESYDPSTLR